MDEFVTKPQAATLRSQMPQLTKRLYAMGDAVASRGQLSHVPKISGKADSSWDQSWDPTQVRHMTNEGRDPREEVTASSTRADNSYERTEDPQQYTVFWAKKLLFFHQKTVVIFVPLLLVVKALRIVATLRAIVQNARLRSLVDGFRSCLPELAR